MKLKTTCKKLNIPIFHKNDKIKMGVLNIRSLNQKSLYISDLVTSNSLDLFGLTETWHESASSPSLLSSIPKGFSFVELARPPSKPLSDHHSSYGGLCLIFKSSFSVSVDSSIKFSSFECLFTSIKLLLLNST